MVDEKIRCGHPDTSTIFTMVTPADRKRSRRNRKCGDSRPRLSSRAKRDGLQPHAPRRSPQLPDEKLCPLTQTVSETPPTALASPQLLFLAPPLRFPPEQGGPLRSQPDPPPSPAPPPPPAHPPKTIACSAT